MDLFGIYGARADGENTGTGGAPEEAADAHLLDPDPPLADERVTDTVEIVGLAPEPESGRHSMEAAVTVYPPEAGPTAARDEQVERYLQEIGGVDESRHIVRPYARTGGRTRSGVGLALETLLVTSATAHPEPLAAEHRFVCRLCVDPLSVAEIAVYTRLPIGAARVVIADMIDLGLLIAGRTESTMNGPSIDLLSRVLHGLRDL
ncbi:DUF742 domain-containing protein [Actinokineospora sp.]|uniref:DUF742 domain-containing protein n=1 Tax=Actinokineospora sp. TaxID=1872133 RepID=UPI004037A26D